MSSFFSKIYPVYVALFGPSDSGKSKFLSTLSGKEFPFPSTDVEEISMERKWYKEDETGKKILAETYKLVLRALPGKEDYMDLRIKYLKKCTGLLLFYDCSSVESVNKLVEMFKKEIEGMNILYNFAAICLVGTKKDLGINDDAVTKAEEFNKGISEKISEIFGYNVPHIVVNSQDPSDVKTVVKIIEWLLMEQKVPVDLVKTLRPPKLPEITLPSQVPKVPLPTKLPETPPSKIPKLPPIVSLPKPPERIPKPPIVTKPSVPAPKPVSEEKAPTPETKIPTEIPKPTPTPALVKPPEEVAKEVEVPTEAIPKAPSEELPMIEFVIKLHPRDKIWSAARKLAERFKEDVENVVIGYKAGKVIYVAFYPGERNEKSIPFSLVNIFNEIMQQLLDLAIKGELGKPKISIHVGSDGALLLALRGINAFVGIKTRKMPSMNLLNMLLKI